MNAWEWPQYLAAGGILALWGHMAGSYAATKASKEFCPPIAMYAAIGVVSGALRLSPIFIALYAGEFWS